MYLSTSSWESTVQRVSPLRTREPAAPPTWTSHLPPSMAVAPTSLVVDSAQLRGQPDTASFILWGDSMPWNRFSIFTPRVVLSPRPKRQKSVPTQVLQVRNALV